MKLQKKDNQIIRVLKEKGEKVFLIDCVKRTMPVWINKSEIVELLKQHMNVEMIAV